MPPRHKAERLVDLRFADPVSGRRLLRGSDAIRSVLTDGERERVLRRWLMRYADAQVPNFVYFTGEVWLANEAAKRAHYRWAGIPPRLVDEWTAECEREQAKQPTTA
jgi:hypothetical protein